MSDITIVNFVIPQRNVLKEDKINVLPLAPLYLASYLEQERGYKVDIKDYQLVSYKEPLKVSNIVSFLKEIDSKVIGISLGSAVLPFLISGLEKLKKEFPNKIIILGGPGPGGVAKEIIKEFDFIDFIIKGEGEVKLLKLMDYLSGNLKSPDKIEGIVYKNEKGKVVDNPLGERIKNLDELPFPAYDKVDPKDYGRVNFITSRGCSFNCIFCDIPHFWQSVNYKRSIDKVIEEIKIAHEKFGFKKFGFADDNFILDRKRIEEFCDKYKKESINAQWSIYARINLTDLSLIKKMAKGGCYGAFFGVESGSNKVLKIINKGFTRKEAKETLLYTLEYIPKVTASFMWGFPFESFSDFLETKNFITELTRETEIMPYIFHLTPFKKTTLYKRYEDYIEPEPSMTGTLNRPVNHDDVKKNKEVLKLVKEYPDIFVSYYRFFTQSFNKKLEIIKEITNN